MAKLRVRSLEPELIRELEHRAQRNGRSLEAEVIEILRVVLDSEGEQDSRRGM